MARALDTEAIIDTLDNGLPVAYRQLAGQVECMGIAIMAGSRDEAPGEYGLAHFVEHTIFKGTTRRRSHHVINRMESVGGELNAYTTKEETFVYTLAPAGNAARAMELLADLVCNASFPDGELAKEREVVADEISSYLDAPDAAVYDDFEDLIFAGSSLGHNILGSKRSVMKLTGGDCRRWVASAYHVGRMAFFYSGPASYRRIMELAGRYLNGVRTSGEALERMPAPQVTPFSESRSVKSHQAHTIIGCRVPALSQRDSDSLALCNNILGGPGMNSRFNVSLREKRGLVYTVESALTRFTDTTLWSVYYGCDKEHVGLCHELIDADVAMLAQRELSKTALLKSQRQFIGQLTLSRAAVENMALALGRCVLRREHFRTARELASDIMSLTAADLSAAASRLLQAPMSALTFQ